MSEIVIEHLSKTFNEDTEVLDDVNLEIGEGEFFVFVGPSGCGKSTLLRCIAGLEEPTAGTIEIGGKVANDLEPRERDIAMVFQDYALYPHLNVSSNLAFGLRRRKLSKQAIEERIAEVANLLEIDDLLKRRPSQLSGGQRQRVAMGRAIVRKPRAFLMDEPLSNLDASLRLQMRSELLRLHQELPTTTIYVTHDQVEAMTMGDRVAVLREGELQQVGPPQLLYEEPVNTFVAAFIGAPPMNLIAASVQRKGDRLLLDVGGQNLLAPPAYDGIVEGQRVIVGVRPEQFIDAGADGADSGLPRLDVRVRTVEHLGSDTLVTFELPGAEDRQALAVGRNGRGSPSFVARLGAHTAAEAGGDYTLLVDHMAARCFDIDSGGALPRAQTGIAAA